MLPQEVQADKLYPGKANRNLIKDCHVDCYNHPLGRPPKDENDCHAEDKKRAIGERNEVEATFGTSKRVYRTNDIRAKLDAPRREALGHHSSCDKTDKITKGAQKVEFFARPLAVFL